MGKVSKSNVRSERNLITSGARNSKGNSQGPRRRSIHSVGSHYSGSLSSLPDSPVNHEGYGQDKSYTVAHRSTIYATRIRNGRLSLPHPRHQDNPHPDTSRELTGPASNVSNPVKDDASHPPGTGLDGDDIDDATAATIGMSGGNLQRLTAKASEDTECASPMHLCISYARSTSVSRARSCTPTSSLSPICRDHSSSCHDSDMEGGLGSLGSEDTPDTWPGPNNEGPNMWANSRASPDIARDNYDHGHGSSDDSDTSTGAMLPVHLHSRFREFDYGYGKAAHGSASSKLSNYEQSCHSTPAAARSYVATAGEPSVVKFSKSKVDNCRLRVRPRRVELGLEATERKTSSTTGTTHDLEHSIGDQDNSRSKVDSNMQSTRLYDGGAHQARSDSTRGSVNGSIRSTVGHMQYGRVKKSYQRVRHVPRPYGIATSSSVNSKEPAASIVDVKLKEIINKLAKETEEVIATVKAWSASALDMLSGPGVGEDVPRMSTSSTDTPTLPSSRSGSSFSEHRGNALEALHNPADPVLGDPDKVIPQEEIMKERTRWTQKKSHGPVCIRRDLGGVERVYVNCEDKDGVIFRSWLFGPEEDLVRRKVKRGHEVIAFVTWVHFVPLFDKERNVAITWQGTVAWIDLDQDPVDS